MYSEVYLQIFIISFYQMRSIHVIDSLYMMNIHYFHILCPAYGKTEERETTPGFFSLSAFDSHVN